MKEEIKETKCKKSILGQHKWIYTRSVSGAGRTFTYKLDIPVCERCGEKSSYNAKI